MSRKAFALGVLFVASFGFLLWLTANDRRAAGEAEAEAARIRGPRSVVALPDSVASYAVDVPGDERGTDEPAVSVAQVSPNPRLVHRPQEAEEDYTPAERQFRELAFTSTPLAIEALARTLRTADDRRMRLAAVNSLLLIGRRSSVDPTIRQALKDASIDKDTLVAERAGAALIEVEHCEPTGAGE
jgi:hypothetical protein